jgi:hypothetical protein
VAPPYHQWDTATAAGHESAAVNLELLAGGNVPMQSPDEERVLRPRVWSHTELAASSERDRMQQAVMNSHKTDVEERQGRSFTQHLMAATVDQTQPPVTPRGMRSVELADIMGAEGTSVEVEEALRAAVSPEPTVEAVASPISVHTLRRDQASPVVTPEGTAKRPRGAKWLCRRPTVRLRTNQAKAGRGGGARGVALGFRIEESFCSYQPTVATAGLNTEGMVAGSWSLSAEDANSPQGGGCWGD